MPLGKHLEAMHFVQCLLPPLVPETLLPQWAAVRQLTDDTLWGMQTVRSCST
jgi:hypothetical protein